MQRQVGHLDAQGPEGSQAQDVETHEALAEEDGDPEGDDQGILKDGACPLLVEVGQLAGNYYVLDRGTYLGEVLRKCAQVSVQVIRR